MVTNRDFHEISENLEEYLDSVNNTVDFTETLSSIKEDCGLEFGGSLVHKYIHILVISSRINEERLEFLKYFRGWLETILMVTVLHS